MDETQEQLWTDVDEYFSGALIQRDPVLERALADSAAGGLPAISVSPLQGQLLAILATSIGARSILEIGTLGGYSTIWLARAMSPDGKVVTLERDPHHAEVARANFARAGLDDRIELIIGDALDSLPRLASESRPSFDVVFIDADKASIPAYFEYALRMSRAGSLIIVDNVVRDGEVIDAESSDASVIGVRKLVQILAATPNVTATVIQTVGTKGYDGLAIVRVQTIDG